MECDNMEVGNSQDQTKDKNIDKETLECETGNNIRNNPELSLIEQENMEAVNNQEQTETERTIRAKRKQIDIRDAMRAQKTAKRYTNRQRI